MILKQTPDDFQVEELMDRATDSGGPFALYRLDKRGWTTPDALQLIRRRWRVDPQRLSYGGLKDRHAHTIQHFTIFRGPNRALQQQGVRVTYLGQTGEPFTSSHIRANRFRITLRDVTAEEQAHAQTAWGEILRDGVPNYFDDQRFGSVSTGGAFLAKELILGNYEGALRLALTAHYAYDSASEKKEKALLRKLWGDWAACKEQLGRSHARSLVTYLVDHPQDFRGAILRLRPELRTLYLSAYQSFLWNRQLALWLEQNLAADQRTPIPLRMGEYPFHRHLTEMQCQHFEALQLPLHSPRSVPPPEDPLRPFFDQVLAADGVTIDQFKLKGLRDLFFSKGARPALSLPRSARLDIKEDETHPGASKLCLGFDLTRGSYATLIVKRLGCVKE